MVSESSQIYNHAGLPVLEQDKCPECGSVKLNYGDEEIVCSECGLVIEGYLIDQGPEWRAFDAEQREKRTRVGAPTTITTHDRGLSTIIDWKNQDIHGKQIKGSQISQIYRLRKLQRRTRVSDAIERNLAFALDHIKKLGKALSLPKSVIETGSVLYQKGAKEKLVRGRSIKDIASATLYYSLRDAGIPRTLKEVSEKAGISKNDLSRSYRYILNKFDYCSPEYETNKFIEKFSENLGLLGKTETIAKKITNVAREIKLTGGRGPLGIAAASTYVASILTGERRTQREIAEVSKVTEVTVRNRYKDLSENLLFVMGL